MQDVLFEFISKYLTLTEEEKNVILSLDLFRSVKKGTVLLKEGQKSKHSYFVLKGCIRTYYVVDCEEKTTAFYTEMDALTPPCVISKTPSEYYISCVEDTILTASNSDMELEVNSKFPKFETMCRILSEELLAKQRIDFDTFKTSSPEQRYLNLIEKRPDLIQRVPQHQLASYLGITPQSLSRLRARMLEKRAEAHLLINLSERIVAGRPSTFATSYNLNKERIAKEKIIDWLYPDDGKCVSYQAQHAAQDSTYKKYFVGSTFLMLGNFIPNDVNPPHFVQLNLGYRITPKDVVFLELKKSRFAFPLGIPWGKSFDKPGENYPGHIRQNVIGLAYNHFWWKGIYTGVHAMNAFQKYYDEQDRKITNGYTLFITYRLGYQFKLLNNRFFIEPSIGLTHWPVKTNTPESFEIMENKWPKYFGFEPGLHFGFNF